MSRSVRLWWWGLGLGVILAAGGCHGMHGSRHVAVAEPALDAPVAEGGKVLAEAPPPPAAPVVGYVDRHPILSKPRDMYNSTQSNKAVKTVAATVVGIPVGVIGEVRQIVVGTPPTAQ